MPVSPRTLDLLFPRYPTSVLPYHQSSKPTPAITQHAGSTELCHAPLLVLLDENR